MYLLLCWKKILKTMLDNTDEVTVKNVSDIDTNKVFVLLGFFYPCVLFSRWASCSEAAGSLVSTSQTAGNTFTSLVCCCCFFKVTKNVDSFVQHVMIYFKRFCAKFIWHQIFYFILYCCSVSSYRSDDVECLIYGIYEASQTSVIMCVYFRLRKRVCHKSIKTSLLPSYQTSDLG